MNDITRRTFFSTALASLLARDGQASQGLPGLPHFAGKAKRVIYLFQHGAPSQLDLFDYKPNLTKLRGENLPESVRMGQRLTGMTAYQAKFPTAPSIFKFNQCGQSGMWLSELLPHTAKVADDICLIRSLHTEAINHDPAVTFFQTGFQLAGRPSIGSWLAYGLGSMSEDLPAFVVMVSQGKGGSQALADRQWASGFLPSKFAGVKFRAGADPVLYLSDPEGYDRSARRRFLDDLSKLNSLKFREQQDPEISTRIAQYEMAFRMQASVPDLTDLSKEPESTFEMYGPDSRKPGSYAANCVLARRLAERGVRFIQLFHRGWDQHSNLPRDIRLQCEQTDQPSAALVRDLKQRGLLEDTIIVWGGEFGRTVYSQGTLTETDYGRDHHPRCFSMWLAGGGIKGGLTYGATDDFSYNIAQDAMDVHDLHATMLHCLGVDHLRLTFKFQGRHYRLTDIQGRVVRALVS
ncbi:MAG: DUF1501 domain-containing protein [Bryobacteraceae bacterium]|nr:DUF1501 domain-containing protein [Bryobacteraceae bacterium]